MQLPGSALLGHTGVAWDLLDTVVAYGSAQLCAEAVVAMEVLNAAALEYLKTRQQFGVFGAFYRAAWAPRCCMNVETEGLQLCVKSRRWQN